MELELKKGSNKRAQLLLMKTIHSKKKKNNLARWCGIIKLKKSPLDIQKEMRDEWE